MFRNLLRLSHPLHLLIAALTYFLGASIANYLGKPFRTDSFWLGLIAVILAQASMSLLAEVFRPSNEAIIDGETRKQRLTFRNNALYISIAALTANAVIAFTIIFRLLPSFFFCFPLLLSLRMPFLLFDLSIEGLENFYSPRIWPISFPLLPIFFNLTKHIVSC